MNNRDVAKIAVRFTDELIAIQRQIDFQQRKAAISVMEISKHNDTLTEFGFEKLPERGYLGLPPHKLDNCEILELLPHTDKRIREIESLQSKLFEKSVEYSEEFDEQEPFYSDQEFHQTCEWVQRIGAMYGHAELLSTSESDIVQQSERSHGGELPPSRLISSAITRAKQVAVNEQASKLFDLQERLGEFKIIAESGEPSAPLGVMRQAFIAMMAGFDAAIGDLVRIALGKDFFRLVSLCDKKLTIEPDAVNSWDELKDSLIEAQVRKHYAVGWLHILNSNWNVFGERTSEEFDFPRVLEQVNRRNVHLHNRGVVYPKYLEALNLDGFVLGDVTTINEAYWNRARDLNERIVRRIASWIATLNRDE